MCNNINFIYPKFLIIFLFSFFCVSVLKGQEAPEIIWTKTFESITPEGVIINSTQKTSDGGYVAYGYKEQNTSTLCYVIKLNELGNKIWEKYYSPTGYSGGYSIRQTSDGGYVILGGSKDGTGDKDCWVMKLDADGNKKWDKTYGGSNNDSIFSIQQTSDGGYILAGYTESNDGDISDGNNGSQDCWIIKLNAIGNKVWDKTYGGSRWDEAASIQQTSDGGYIFSASISSTDGDVNSDCFGYSCADVWVVKLNSVGDKVWDKVYGDDFPTDYARMIQKTLDGGYVLIFTSYTSNGQGFSSVIKLNNSGNEEWSNTEFGPFSYDYNSPRIIHQTKDGGYLIGGHTQNTSIVDLNRDWLTKLDSLGNKSWHKDFVGRNNINSIKQTADGGYVVGSRKWLVKLGADISVSTNDIKNEKNNFTIYPNPANSQVVIGTDLIQPIGEVLITDMTGKIVKQFQTQKSTKEIDISTLENGIYFVKAGGASQKLVKK